MRIIWEYLGLSRELFIPRYIHKMQEKTANVHADKKGFMKLRIYLIRNTDRLVLSDHLKILEENERV